MIGVPAGTAGLGGTGSGSWTFPTETRASRSGSLIPLPDSLTGERRRDVAIGREVK